MPPASGVTATLLLSCREQKGLVAAVSDFLYRNDGNIIHADQHTDREQQTFIQRVEWQLEGFRVPRPEIADAFRPLAERFGMTVRLAFSDEVPRLAILVSKQAHCFWDLLARVKMGELRAEVPLVISNHDELRPIAEAFGVPWIHLPVSPDNEVEQNRRIGDLLDEHRIDLVVLARYMRILRPELVARRPNGIINIHHSFLPAFVGARPYHQAYERGVKIIGATAHYVTADLDQGPIISQDVAHVSHRESVNDLVKQGRDLEKIVLARAVDLHLSHRVLVYGNKTVVFD